ncbi:nuclear transport factor 2 family protein [Reichenbachiella carrageenanivorans]|uniref:Nuclear transport factor 2 family protein n=1 Tax=Reichenbachiella carrageenanivorans TaxID=2979869 RepID=A0ABY6CUM7_9BACT|nr:nuclear transport factor 2 family protein [Reichenbachiella carrageenanivorans]UXX77627.1 nuclear transport factor 2 family protein [Reichenbachiella carrageenanivorans]
MQIKAHVALIEKFYTAFSQKDAKTMAACYHQDLAFEDPAFGVLNHRQACAMWVMLLSGSSDIEISFKNVWSENEFGGVDWEAKYLFSKTGRKVHNVIDAKFEFKDGLIVGHRDHFDFYKWSRMALGMSGVLLGWTGFLHRKVQAQCAQLLSKHMAEHC